MTPPSLLVSSARRARVALVPSLVSSLVCLLIPSSRLPAPELAEPFAFLEDELLPRGFAPVEPTSSGLAFVQSAWGPDGPRN